MKKLLTAISLTLFCNSALAFAAPQSSGAQVKGAEATKREQTIMGDLDIEQDTKVSPYKISQDRAIAYVDGLKNHLDKMRSGSLEAYPILNAKKDTSVLSHLIGVYFYCSVKAGTCPLVLDAILEIDIIASRLSKSASCPSMLAFWTLWKGGDMEAKLRYATKTSFMSKVADFNSKIRPRYLLCAETVKTEIDSNDSDSEYLKKRYAESSNSAKSISQLDALLNQLREKVSNVYSTASAQ